MTSIGDTTRAEYCIIACADAWRGGGETFASPMGLIPSLGARVARATFEPNLMLSDGEATFVAGNWGVADKPTGPVESWIPFRTVFDLAWSGRRHVMMSPAQIDAYGNANISRIGDDFQQPKVQLLGMRGAPGNTVSHPTSYWVNSHNTQTFVDSVDAVCGVGYDRAADLGEIASQYLDLRRVVSRLGVFDFATSSHRMRVVSLHPGVDIDEVVSSTGFNLEWPTFPLATRDPTAEELNILRTVLDPGGLREVEVSVTSQP